MTPQQTTSEPVDPRTIGTDGDGIVRLGTSLRDAAVDPRPGDRPPQGGSPHSER